jgi:hypothetical protein
MFESVTLLAFETASRVPVPGSTEAVNVVLALKLFAKVPMLLTHPRKSAGTFVRSTTGTGLPKGSSMNSPAERTVPLTWAARDA